MTLIKRFLLLFVWRRVAAALIGGVALFSVFDLMKASESLWSARGNPVENIAVYLVLRIPSLAAFLLPIAMLVGALAAFSTLARRNEVIILQATGMRLKGLAGWSLIAAAPAALLHALLLFTIAPAADYRLSAWLADKGVKSDEDIEASERLSIAAPGLLVEADTASPTGSDILSPLIISLSETGAIDSISTGARAIVMRGSGAATWVLENARRTSYPIDGPPVVASMDSLNLEGMPRRDVVRNAQRPVEHLSLAGLIRQSHETARGETAPHKLAVNAAKRIAAIAGSLLMLLLAGPVALAHARARDSSERALAAILLAFAFIVFDRTLFSLGLAGHLPAFIAGAGATIIAIPLALAALIRLEKKL